MKPFGAVLRDLLIERGTTTRLGNVDWPAFAAELPTVKYESLRKAVAGDRPPGEKVMEEVAHALGVEPDVFYEYRLLQAQRQFDPRVVGPDAAIEALERFTEAMHAQRESPRRARRSGRVGSPATEQ